MNEETPPPVPVAESSARHLPQWVRMLGIFIAGVIMGGLLVWFGGSALNRVAPSNQEGQPNRQGIDFEPRASVLPASPLPSGDSVAQEPAISPQSNRNAGNPCVAGQVFRDAGFGGWWTCSAGTQQAEVFCRDHNDAAIYGLTATSSTGWWCRLTDVAPCTGPTCHGDFGNRSTRAASSQIWRCNTGDSCEAVLIQE